MSFHATSAGFSSSIPNWSSSCTKTIASTIRFRRATTSASSLSEVGGDDIIRQPVVPLRRLLVAAPEYFKRHGRPKHPDELSLHRCAHNNYILPIADITFMGPRGRCAFRRSGRWCCRTASG